MHINPNVKETVKRLLANHDRITFCQPVGYCQCIIALSDVDLVLTDSGGIQEEAPALGKQELVLRETTERPESVSVGTARLVGTNTEEAVEQSSTLLSDQAAYDAMAKAVNPYSDGLSARRITSILTRDCGFIDAAIEEFSPE